MKLYMVKLHLPHNEKAWIQVYAVSSSRARSHLSPLLCDILKELEHDDCVIPVTADSPIIISTDII
jgi:hypothetical protein